jgi:ATP-dependent Clp protease ATP-binding subunit ClpX
VEVFHRYGFLPELIGRFSAIVRLAPLGERELREILVRNVLPRYEEEFRREGLTLKVPAKVIKRIVKDALDRKTGARGLTLQLTRYLEEQAFEQFGRDDGEQVERLA